MRILLIDDNEDAAESLRLLLDLEGHETTVAHDGETGLEEARRIRPDAILCDLDLPGRLDGYDVARSLREDADFESVALVALTGYGREEVFDAVAEAGFDEHLMKPIDLGAIQKVLDRVMDSEGDGGGDGRGDGTARPEA